MLKTETEYFCIDIANDNVFIYAKNSLKYKNKYTNEIFRVSYRATKNGNEAIFNGVLKLLCDFLKENHKLNLEELKIDKNKEFNIDNFNYQAFIEKYN